MDDLGMMKELLLHPFIGKNPESLTKLAETTYPGREISNKEYLSWEYFQNPYGNALINVAEDDDKLVSQYIVLPREFSVSGKTIQGSLSVNTLTHPDFRGRELFTRLAKITFDQCRDRKIEFTVGLPNSVSYPVIKGKNIFETAGNLNLMILPLSITGSILKYLKSKKEKTGEEIELELPERYFIEHTGISLLNLKNDSEKYSEFLKVFNKEKQNVNNRSLQFLLWRYLNIPYRKYYLFKQERENEIESIAIFRSRTIYGMRCGILTDYMTLKDSKDTGGLLGFIRKLAIENKLDLIFTALPSHSFEYDSFQNAGYFTIPQFILPQKLVFIVKQHSESCPQQVHDFKKWFLTFGDFDIF